MASYQQVGVSGFTSNNNVNETYMEEQKYENKKLGIELKSYFDKNYQKIWFKAQDITKILGYSKSRDAIARHVDNRDKKTVCCRPRFVDANNSDLRAKNFTFINESGFYSLVLSSHLKLAKEFKYWVTSEVLPSIRKYGYFKMFDNPNDKMFKIENENDLHYKVVHLSRKYCPNSILVPGLGENQDTSEKRIDSWKKGYQKGQPDIMILDYHKYYKGLCIEFKSPTNNYCVSDSQIKMKEKYENNNYKFILSNDYDYISKEIYKYMEGVRLLCKYCPKAFLSKKTLNNHYKVIHRIEKNI